MEKDFHGYIKKSFIYRR